MTAPIRKGFLRSAAGTLGQIISAVLIGIVRAYQVTLSPIVGRHCRFRPTCSHYFIEAVRVRGPLVGTALGVWRILRCQPFSRGGYDPVPRKAPAIAPTPESEERERPNDTEEPA